MSRKGKAGSDLFAGRENGKPRVALGMSGGVDSAVAAALLAAAGYEVVGVTCLFVGDGAEGAGLSKPQGFPDAVSGSMAASGYASDPVADAKAVCELLGLRHEVWDSRAEFEERVVAPFVRAFAAGLTPSPCVVCNAGCKIPALLAAADVLGCDLVATGHYARVVRLDNGRFAILSGLDERKDQSYMLGALTQAQLARLVLPLGAMTKAEVRVRAQDLGLPVAHKPESQDICFVNGSYADFLAGRGVTGQPGGIVDTAGKVVGRHAGLVRYTLGQRKGIGVAAAAPYYVIGKRDAENQLVVGFAQEARISGVRLDTVNWMAFEGLERPLECLVKLRYRSRAVPCTVEPVQAAAPALAGAAGAGVAAASGVRVNLLSPQPTTAPGQFAAFYLGNTLLGAGEIRAVVP